jgi:hypothetical protein
MIHMSGIRALSCASVLLALAGTSLAAPVDGVISPTEGWTHMLEGVNGRPFLGGSLTNSDLIGETSSFNWWDNQNNVNRAFNDNRGDIIDTFLRSDGTNLHIGLKGPNVAFNNWFAGGGPGQDNDQGDIFFAIDVAGGAAGGSLQAAAGHTSFGGAKAVDFDGWTPTHFAGIQYADNGGGGGGFANVFGVGSGQLAGEGQFAGNGGFEWGWSVDGSDGVFELTIPWSLLGYGAEPTGIDLRFNAYTTQNFAASDAYDSGPGFGNGSVTEQIGDNPGDPDSGGQFGASDPGSFGQPGANFVGSPLAVPPSQNDEIDTLAEYWTWRVPSPGSASLGVLAAATLLRRSRSRG